MVHGNTVFIIEEVKLARNTHTIHYQSETSLLSTQHKTNYTTGSKKLFAHVIMTWLGGIIHKNKNRYLYVAERFMFSQQLARSLKKSSTMNGPKSSFWVTS